MKKVLVVITTQFVPFGGLTTVAMNYYRCINHERIRMDFASTNDAPIELKKELNKNGDSYYRLPRRKHVLKYMKSLKRMSSNYDIVHVHGNSTTAAIELLSAKIAGVRKRIVHSHNTTCTHKLVHKLLRPIFDRTYTDAIGCSKAAGKWLFGKKKFIVLNNAIDVHKYEYIEGVRNEIKNELGFNGASVIGNVGKLTFQKNHEFLIRCFSIVHKKNPNTKLLIVGGGDRYEELYDMVNDLGVVDDVVFTGMVNSAAPYLSAMDCFVFPSRWEGLPLSVLEAQANGLRCIVSNKVTKEVNVSKTIRFLPIEDTEYQWAMMILENLNHDRNHDCLFMQSMLKKKNYDISTNAIRLEEIYFE